MSDESYTKKSTPKWASRIGFIMTAAGAAVGLGNLQRFPQLVAKHGGGAFLLLYLLCVIIFGLPLMLAELSIGRASKSDPVNAFSKLAPTKKYWGLVGALGSLIAFMILSYYTVSCSWTLAFVFKASSFAPVTFSQVSKDSNTTVWFFILFHAFVTFVVLRGLNEGVEKFSKVVMPLMLIIQLILIIRIVTLPGSLEGIIYYLKPDFSKLRMDSLLNALSQAFFSLCVGEAVLLTYGSYSGKKDSLPLSAFYISSLDTAVAVLSGMIIIPAMFITGEDPSQGMGLIYNTLFGIFHNMQGGSLFLVLYFVILAIAGLTTCITLMEVSSHTLHKNTPLSKKNSILLVSLCGVALGIPSLLSNGVSSFLTDIEFLGARGFCEIMDFVWGSLGMTICGLLTTVFVGWIWGTESASKELEIGSPIFQRSRILWSFHIKWTAPLVILGILLSLFFV